MTMDPELLKRIQAAVESGKVATPEDLLEGAADEIVMDPDYLGYFSVKVTGYVDAMQTQPVTHLKLTPLVSDGIVLIQPAAKGDLGAIEFARGETRRTGRLNLRPGLAGFNLTFHENRNLKLPVKTQTITVNGQQRTILVIELQKLETKPRVARPRKPKAEQSKKDQPNNGEPQKGDPGSVAPGCQVPEESTES